MIRINVLYPGHPNARFDFNYYLRHHMPMVKDRLAEFGLTGTNVDKGIACITPGTPAPYTCICTLDFESLDHFQKAFATHGNEILGDIPNYTDIQPIMQISEPGL